MKKYVSPLYYINYLRQKTFDLVSLLLRPFESSFNDRFGDEGIRKFPPVFIIGAPRCGSTLLYKVLTEQYRFSYFTNFTCNLFKIPACAFFIQNKIGIKTPRGNYDFHYGRIDGFGSPSECGQFWYRWFPGGMNAYVPPRQIERVVMDELRRTIGGVSHVTGRPLIVKNLYNSMRIAPIMEAIPEARFLICRRDMVDNALSILKGRMLNLMSKDIWWSTPPEEIEALLEMHYSEQVAGQVYYLYKQIDEDKMRFGEDCFLEVEYESFCRDVHATLQEIELFLNINNSKKRREWIVPNQFEVMGVDGIEVEDRMLVEKACRSFLNL
jgi:hypothetical protein